MTCNSNLIQTNALVNTCTFMAAAAVVFSCFMLMLSRRTFSYSLVKLVPWVHTCYLPCLSLFMMNGLALVSIYTLSFTVSIHSCLNPHKHFLYIQGLLWGTFTSVYYVNYPESIYLVHYQRRSNNFSTISFKYYSQNFTLHMPSKFMYRKLTSSYILCSKTSKYNTSKIVLQYIWCSNI